jgi:hypothetical protein
MAPTRRATGLSFQISGKEYSDESEVAVMHRINVLLD